MTTHSLEPNMLPGLTEDLLQALRQEGFHSVEALARATPERLAPIVAADLADQLIGAACERVMPPVVIPLERTPPSSDQLTRGLDAARAIENTAGLTRKARSHSGKTPPRKLEWTHRRARRQLKKLVRALEGLQREVLTLGLTEVRAEALLVRLTEVDSLLQDFLAAPMDKRALQLVRRVAKHARKDLAG